MSQYIRAEEQIGKPAHPANLLRRKKISSMVGVSSRSIIRLSNARNLHPTMATHKEDHTPGQNYTAFLETGKVTMAIFLFKLPFSTFSLLI